MIPRVWPLIIGVLLVFSSYAHSKFLMQWWKGTRKCSREKRTGYQV